jgi:N-acetylglucosamine kinase-like BadF-type ATPase
MSSETPARPPDRPSAFLGIDAGGSRTTAVLTAADGTELGRAEGPSGAVRPGQVAGAALAIIETARRAAFGTDVTLPVAGAVVGAAGAGRALEREQLTADLVTGEALARAVRVMGDVELALHAAFGADAGVVVAAGTGSAAFARTPDGVLHRAGGYGWQLGDEGGGYWLGRRALALAARDQDGVGEWSGLGVGILRALELGSFDDLVRWASTAAPAQIAALAPVLLAAARDRASPAAAVMREGADALAALVTVLLTGFPGEAPVPVATTGTLLGPEAPLRAALAESLARSAPRARLLSRRIDPALAAARLASASPRS